MFRKWILASILTLGFTLSAGSNSFAGHPNPTVLPVFPNPTFPVLRPGLFPPPRPGLLPPPPRFEVYQVVYRTCDHEPWRTYRIYRQKCDAKDAARYLRSLGYQVRIWD